MLQRFKDTCQACQVVTVAMSHWPLIPESWQLLNKAVCSKRLSGSLSSQMQTAFPNHLPMPLPQFVSTECGRALHAVKYLRHFNMLNKLLQTKRCNQTAYYGAKCGEIKIYLATSSCCALIMHGPYCRVRSYASRCGVQMINVREESACITASIAFHT